MSQKLVPLDKVLEHFDSYEKHAEIKGYFHHKALRKTIEKMQTREPIDDILAQLIDPWGVEHTVKIGFVEPDEFTPWGFTVEVGESFDCGSSIIDALQKALNNPKI